MKKEEKIILTKELFEKGTSLNGAWSNKQLKCFGINAKEKGWTQSIIGKDFPQTKLQEYIAKKVERFEMSLNNIIPLFYILGSADLKTPNRGCLTAFSLWATKI